MKNNTASRRRFLYEGGLAVGSVVLSKSLVSAVVGQEVRQEGRSFDYIVVGAGSAGCVVASRLAEDGNKGILLLEAGGLDDAPHIHDPRKWAALQKTGVDWNYSTAEEKHLNNRLITWPRGKVLGGSSSINAMIYMRGHRSTFDEWSRMGNAGWDFDSVLPYFKMSEDNSRGRSEFHGVGGPLSVMDHPEPCQFVPAFVDSAKALGFQGSVRLS